MSDDYDDGNLRCDVRGLTITGYYFPGVAKHVPYPSIKALRRVDMSVLRGRGRIWGSANFKYWANLDLKRPTKHVGFMLDTGSRVQPFLTPSDPDAFETTVRERAGLGPDTGGAAPLL